MVVVAWFLVVRVDHPAFFSLNMLAISFVLDLTVDAGGGGGGSAAVFA